MVVAFGKGFIVMSQELFIAFSKLDTSFSFVKSYTRLKKLVGLKATLSPGSVHSEGR